MLKREKRKLIERQPYFVEYMAMTPEEKKTRLLWKKDHDKKQRQKAKPIVTKKALKDPRIRRQRDELVKGVNDVIHAIGKATVSGKKVKRSIYADFDRLQRKAAIPINYNLGPGQYTKGLLKNERKIGKFNFAASIARPEVLERILKKQKRERDARDAGIRKKEEAKLKSIRPITSDSDQTTTSSI